MVAFRVLFRKAAPTHLAAAAVAIVRASFRSHGGEAVKPLSARLRALASFATLLTQLQEC